MDDVLCSERAKKHKNEKKVDYFREARGELPLAELESFTKMTSLNFCENKLVTIDGISRLRNLTELFLTGNFIEELPSDFFQLSSLKKLFLKDNDLGYLPVEMCKMRQLSVLNVEGNRLVSVPAQFARLNLTELNLARNRLRSVPLEFGATKITVTTNGNRRITKPPFLVSEKGPKAVQKWLVAEAEKSSSSSSSSKKSKKVDKEKEKKEKEKMKKSKSSASIAGTGVGLDSQSEAGSSHSKMDYLTLPSFENLRACLDHADGRTAFRTFLAGEYCTENLDFLEEAHAYRTAWPTLDQAARVQRAQDLFKKFIIDGSPAELNLPGSVKRDLLNARGRMDTEIFETIFDRCVRSVFNTLERDPFVRFMIQVRAAKGEASEVAAILDH